MLRLFCFVILAGLSFEDAKRLEIPDEASAAIAGAAFILQDPMEALLHLPGFAAVWALYLLCLAICGALGGPVPVGMGDIKLISVLCLATGPKGTLTALAFAGVLSGLASAILLAAKKVTPASEIPLVPFIAAGYALFLFSETSL